MSTGYEGRGQKRKLYIITNMDRTITALFCCAYSPACGAHLGNRVGFFIHSIYETRARPRFRSDDRYFCVRCGIIAGENYPLNFYISPLNE